VKKTSSARAKAPKGTGFGTWCLFSGPEQHLKREALARLRAEARAGGEGEEPSWEGLDGSSATAREVLNRSQTGALFGGARVIVVREAERMDGEEQEALAKGVGALPPGVTVVLATAEAGDRGRRRSIRAGLRRAIDKAGRVVEFRALNVREAAAWAVMRAKELGKKLAPAAAQKLVEQKVGTGLGDLEMEIEKLAMFVGEGDTIMVAHVDEVTPQLVEEHIFRLMDAVGRREAGRAVAILRGLLADKREEPGRIVWQLSQTIRLIWQAKILAERGWRPGKEVDESTKALLPQEERKNALREFARYSWKANRTLEQAKKLSWGQLAQAVRALHGCDLAMKGIRGKVTDDAVAVELLLVELCTGLEMPVWKSPKGERVLG